MGRAISMENRQDDFDRRLKLMEEALDELLQNGTRVHHVDLAEDLTKERDIVVEGTKVEPDKILTPPAKTHKKTKNTTKETVSA